MAMINCKDCNAEISDEAKSCPKCGRPVGFFDPLPGSVSVALGTAISIAIACGAVWFFFFKSSVEVTNEKIKDFIFYQQISFTARNSGPPTTYSYHVRAGDGFWDAITSPKYCEGSFQILRDQTKNITANCRDLTFNFSKYYSIEVEKFDFQ